MGMFSQTRTRSPNLAFSGGAIVGVSKRRTVPVGNVLVRDAGCDIEHDDTALAVDVVAIS